ncbi:hypothetical protein B0H10DRAFT_2439442 [Mycena sp. CBHHK59/15]|nr:hypothetical protein B0H10DRAFT_2439442 [Mycena sp. CBHHK59/15]
MAPKFSSSTETGMTLLPLPQELILLVYEYLPIDSLINVSQTSSLTRRLALLALLARHGISETQIQSQEFRNVPSDALRALSASYGSIVPNIRVLDSNFEGTDIDHYRGVHALLCIAERSPTVISSVTLRFTGSNRGFSPRFSALPSALAALCGNTSLPVVIISNRMGKYLHAYRPTRTNTLKRAWRALKGEGKAPLVDKITSAIEDSGVISMIQVCSFPEPAPAFSSLIVINPACFTHFSIGNNAISHSELQFTMFHLSLPALRILFIRAEINFAPFSAFLERHAKLSHLEFTSDWRALYEHSLPPFSISALPRLSHLWAHPRLMARLLEAPNEFPLLEHIVLLYDAPANDTRVHFQAALRALASRASVCHLTIHLEGTHPPWHNFDAEGAEKDLQYIWDLHLLRWTHKTRYDKTFPDWLGMFPALRQVVISGDLLQPSREQLIPNQLAVAIKAACPGVDVIEHRRLE